MSTQQVIDNEEFTKRTRALIGLPVSRSWRGHGSSMFLELGRLRAVPLVSSKSRPTKPASQKGEITVMIEWSWRIERARSIEAGSFSTDAQFERAIAGLQGRTVEEIEVISRLPEIVITLSGGRWVHSFMTSDAQPVWTIFLRDRSWLAVERGRLIRNTQNVRSVRRAT